MVGGICAKEWVSERRGHPDTPCPYPSQILHDGGDGLSKSRVPAQVTTTHDPMRWMTYQLGRFPNPPIKVS